ncbi:MAG: hypothetical protein U0271_38690 [Polyangiaceae bacterium]
MGCIFALLALVFPRLTLAGLWLFGGDYLGRAFEHRWYLPVLGFVFLPLTTLAYAYGMISIGRSDTMEPSSWLLVAIALMLDVSSMRSGQKHAKKRWQPQRGRDRQTGRAR